MATKTLAEQAAARAVRKHKLSAPTIVDHVHAVGEEQRQIHRFTVVEAADPNGPAHHVFLNHDGRALEPTLEGETLFEPPVTVHHPAPRGPAAAPITIQPTRNILTLNPGEAFEEKLTVTVPKSGGAAKADVYLLADNTGSMSTILSAVQAGSSSVLAALGGLGIDLAIGVGNYKDFLGGDAYAFKHQLAPTSAAAQVTAAIGTWAAQGGGDLPEAAFFALHQIAEPPGGSIGWRSGTKRIVVWFGDAPSHDAICAAASGLGPDITEASVTARLQAEKIAVLAISTKTPGLDDDPKLGAFDYQGQCGPPGGSPGQATRIANTTSGQFVTGIDASTIVATIVRLVTAAVTGINNIRLVPSASIVPFVSSLTPAAGYGPLPADTEHTLTFDLHLVGIPCNPEPQLITGKIDVVADGAVVASKDVQITVPPCAARGAVYSVKFICGTQPVCDCTCGPVQPGRYSTAISIHNDTSQKVEIVKRFVPLVFAGAPAGREPRSVGPRAEDRIVLPPHTATFDDCCRINELLLGAPSDSATGLTIGFVELTASAEVTVTAIYTTSAPEESRDACGIGPSMSVEIIARSRS